MTRIQAWRPTQWWVGSALLVLAAAGLWVGLVAAPRERARFIRRWRDQLSAMADDRESAIERWAAAGLGDARLVASFPVVASMTGDRGSGVRDEDRAHLDAILRLVTVQAGYLNALVLASDGGPVARMGEEHGTDPVDLQLARQCMHAGRPLTAFHLRGGTKPIVDFVAPVVSGASAPPVGAVLLTADPANWLYPFLNHQPVPTDTGETVLVQRDGDDAVFLTQLRHSAAPPLTFRRPLSTPGLAAAAALKGREAFSEYVDYRGVRVFAVARGIRGTPWGLFVKVDRDEALAGYRRWLAGTVAILAALLLAAGGLLLGGWSRNRLRVREAAAANERRLAELVHEANDAVFVLSARGAVLQANRRAEELYGYSEEELRRLTIDDLQVPEAREGAKTALLDAKETGGVVETVHRRRDGSTFPVEVSIHHADVRGERFLFEAVRDIGPQKSAEARIRRLNRLFRTISEINQLIVRERDRDQLLDEACRILVEHGEFRMAWIGVADEASGTVIPAAWAGVEDGYLGTVTIRFGDTPFGRGPTGTAIREGRTVIVNDWEADERVAPWREAARQRGYRSSAAFPVSVGGTVTGALTVYMGETGAFDDEVATLLAELAGDLAFALEALAATTALRESEERFRQLAEAMPDALIVGQDGKNVYANAAAARLLRAAGPEELVGLDMLAIVEPAQTKRAWQRVQRALAGEELAPFEDDFVRRDGSLVPVELAVSPLTWRGRPALRVVVRDITERKRADSLKTAIYEISEAAQQATRLDDLFAAVHRIVGRLMDAENFYIALYGSTTNLISFPYFVDDVDDRPDPLPIGKGMTSYVIRSGLPLLATPEVLRDLEERGEIQSLGAASIDWLGVPLKVQDRVIGVLAVQSYSGNVRYGEADKEVLSYVSAQVAQAIERKQAEDELRSSEARFRSYFELPLYGVGISSPEKRWIRVNDRLCSILGYFRHELTTMTWSEMTHPEDLEANVRLFDRLLAGEIDHYALEKRFIRKDGQVIWTNLSAACVRKPYGGVDYLVVVVEDISEKKAAGEALEHSRAQLLQAQKMEAVGRLAGGVAHDFNNVLQALLSQAQLLHIYAHDPERVKTLGLELGQQISHGASLTRQLLLFSRRETARPELLDLNDSVRDATTMLRRLVRANIAVEIKLASEALPVTADRGQLEQVLVNLAVNAADAMPEGGTLIIRTGAPNGEHVSLTVEDTGTGIPEAIRGRIFEPFFTTKEAARGTGLGLSVVHGIVTQHGGRIEVESVEGQGAVFRVILPAARARKLSAAEGVPQGAAEQAAGQGERILVVEDEDAAREALRDILRSLGYEVIAVASGEDAGALSPEQPFDVLLTDLMLPGISGPQLAAGLRDRWPSLKVILMSGYTEDEAVRRGVGEGNIRFLQKPFGVAVLAAEVQAALAGGL